MKLQVIVPYCYDPEDIVVIQEALCPNDQVYFVPKGELYTLSKTDEQLKARIKVLQSQKRIKSRYVTRTRRYLRG